MNTTKSVSFWNKLQQSWARFRTFTNPIVWLARFCGRGFRAVISVIVSFVILDKAVITNPEILEHVPHLEELLVIVQPAVDWLTGALAFILELLLGHI